MCVYTYINREKDYKALAHAIIEADKPQDLQAGDPGEQMM